MIANAKFFLTPNVKHSIPYYQIPAFCSLYIYRHSNKFMMNFIVFLHLMFENFITFIFIDCFMEIVIFVATS